MTISILDGWFCDRASGQGKPVYSSGTTVVPTNGIVGRGLVGSSTAGTFVASTPTPLVKSLLDGWFCDRAPGSGKSVYSTGTTIVPTNGIVTAAVPSAAPAPGAGGKFYFEITVIAHDVDSLGFAQNAGQQIGFINAAQKNNLSSYNFEIVHGSLDTPPSTRAGGRSIAQGRDNADGAAVWFGHSSPQSWICGTQVIDVASTWLNGNIIGVAIDTINNRFWARNYSQTMAQPYTFGWAGAGNPQDATNGYDIHLMTGAVYIWFGAPGRFSDSVTLNAGKTAFYGLNGTGVIPTGYSAWDATGETTWSQSDAGGTGIVGVFTDTAGVLPSIVAGQGVGLSNNRLTATVATTTAFFSTLYGSLWKTADTYVRTAVVLDSQSPNYVNSFYFSSTTNGPGALNQPVGNSNWESTVMGAVSNTSKARV